jgi:hypothetical protein
MSSGQIILSKTTNTAMIYLEVCATGMSSSGGGIRAVSSACHAQTHMSPRRISGGISGAMLSNHLFGCPIG